MRTIRRVLALAVGVGASAWGLGEREAQACGGCFTPPSESESVITDEKMILSISMTQTTLYDQINYSGSPASFAWVLPIKGTVTVGLSADVMFQVVNQLTTTTVEAPASNCPPAPICDDGFDESSDTDSSDGSGSGSGGVIVTSQAQVGPYETVQLHSTDGSALTTWLTSHGYQIPDTTKPVIDAYVSQQFDFLALKLVPGVGVQSMQPVRVTSQGAAPTLPLHMVAIGTGPVTGITIWVVADGRWEPSNFPTFTISDSQIAWDWATSSSNYETLRTTAEAKYGGRGWQIESSLELSQYTIEQTLESAAEYDPTGGYLVGLADAGAPDAASHDASTPDASRDAASRDAGAPDAGDEGSGSGDFGSGSGDFGSGSGDGDYDAGPQANASAADLAIMFAGIAAPNVRITRMRSDVAQAALSEDMILQASADQSELTNIHTPQLQINEPQCTVYGSECEVVGTVPQSQANAGADGGGCATAPPRGRTEATVGLLLAVAGVLRLRLRYRRRRDDCSASLGGLMRRMRRAGWVGVGVAGAVLGTWGLAEPQAHACGGCFTPVPPPQQTTTDTVSVITDEKMILSISMNQTTLYDQINYSGSPSSFAWVLPIKGTVTVGLSADILFQTINSLTATQITSPPANCPPSPACSSPGGGGCGFGASSSVASGFEAPESVSGGYADFSADAGAGVFITSQQQVGPYETVQLHSTDGSALTNWLTQHGYEIPASTKPIVDAYVSQGFDFLALKLIPGAGVQSMQPVRVTTQGATPSLPLHMVAIGTGPVTGITIWIVADGRWQPSNFPTFVVPASQIAWDWSTSSSNYETLRLSQEAQYGGRGWQIESSLELNQYSLEQSVISFAESDPTGGYLFASTDAGTDSGVADAGAGHDGGFHDAGAREGGFLDAGSESGSGGDFGSGSGSDFGSGSGSDFGSGSGIDFGSGSGSDFGGGENGFGDGSPQSNAAEADLAVLLNGIAQPNFRITRMRSDVAQSALSEDMALEAATDQTELGNLYVPHLEIGEPLCPVYNTTSCVQTGSEPRSQAVAAANSANSSGCSTTPPRDESRTALVLFLAMAGITGVRLRRRAQR